MIVVQPGAYIPPSQLKVCALLRALIMLLLLPVIPWRIPLLVLKSQQSILSVLTDLLVVTANTIVILVMQVHNFYKLDFKRRYLRSNSSTGSESPGRPATYQIVPSTLTHLLCIDVWSLGLTFASVAVLSVDIAFIKEVLPKETKVQLHVSLHIVLYTLAFATCLALLLLYRHYLRSGHV